MKRRWNLFGKYATLIVALVGGSLLVSGAVSLYFSYLENQQQLIALQQEKALAAATRIEQYIVSIEHELGWTALPRTGGGDEPLKQLRYEYLKLLRQAPAITEVAWIDSTGKEQLRVSRLAMDMVASETDYSQDAKVLGAKSGKTWYSSVYFRKETEPYITIARPAGGSLSGATVAEVNLKFVWEVVSRIQIGKAGKAFAVDAAGTLIAHPDMSLVLQKTDMTRLSQVMAAIKGTDADPLARNLQGLEVLSAHARIPTLDWAVFVEVPLSEALAPLFDTILRTGLILLAALVLSILASVFLARRMVTPIQALQRGAAEIGTGHLDQRIEVQTGDELETLAEQFNNMAKQLQASYAGLESKVEERTRELTESLEQQTATSEILRVISRSQTDEQPVFETIAKAALDLCRAVAANVSTFDGKLIHMVAMANVSAEGADAIRKAFPMPPGRETASARAILTRSVVAISDVRADPDYTIEAAAVAGGFRSAVAVPLMRGESAIGAIAVGKLQPGPFSDKQIGLLQTFADQAVIAIENVRLFKELDARTTQLTRSVGELKALGEVGQAVSSTLDLDTVLSTIVSRAVQLAGMNGGAIYEYDESRGEFYLRTTDSLPDDLVDALKATPIRKGEGAVGQLADSGEPVQIRDIADQGVYHSGVQEILIRSGYRSLLAVPLLRENHLLGGLVVNRNSAGEFAPEVIELLRTFSTQSAMAIQNARLFREIEDKGHQLEVANRHKSEFLANMSHELRTPLNAVIGFSEVLAERLFGELNAKQAEYVNDIHESGRHLLSLINDILDLAKIEAGRMELELSSFDITGTLKDAMTLVRERAGRNGIQLEVDAGDDIGSLVADERKIKQVLLNLLSNAVKFTPQGGTVTLSARHCDEGVEIAVADTGVGIAPEDHEKVFEEFRQVGTDGLKKSEGTGLGLALTQRIVELHGGKITLASALGKGSVFTVTLPERQAEVV